MLFWYFIYFKVARQIYLNFTSFYVILYCLKHQLVVKRNIHASKFVFEKKADKMLYILTTMDVKHLFKLLCCESHQILYLLVWSEFKR